MEVIYGGSAITPSKSKTLIEQLQINGIKLNDISAQYVHFVNADKISDQDLKVLEQLFDYGDKFGNIEHTQQFIVAPRLGTQSPWSSKAGDIVKSSELDISRVERGIVYYLKGEEIESSQIRDVMSDRMSEIVVRDISELDSMFEEHEPKKLKTFDVLGGGKDVLIDANKELSTGLSDSDIDYLYEQFVQIQHNPTDVELMMYAQINSEHCRHHIFNAKWKIDGKDDDKSLFSYIKDTYKKTNRDILSAYSDNAAITKGYDSLFFTPNQNGVYQADKKEPVHLVSKVETHNHPTAISPDPGAGTGIGGEIRDEGATGIGARSKMGLTGFSVSNLNIPGYELPWEKGLDKPDRIASPLDIMIDAPLGGAHYANEFGRINLTGYFRTYEQNIDGVNWGYHKPIMLAGGLGNIRSENTHKKQIEEGDLLIVLGGPAMLIGLGGGAASSVNSGESDSELDFASVQRANAELERRAQEVISYCANKSDDNPIVSIHDVGAGGLSNALPELVHDADRGAVFELRDVLNAEPGMSPLEIWCNEAQERYVLAIKEKDLDEFEAICKREKCTYSVVGRATKEMKLVVNDKMFGDKPVDLPMGVLFNNKRRREIEYSSSTPQSKKSSYDMGIKEAVDKVIQHPTVASKKFLITIGDRSVGGLTVRDQMVGPWQVPVADTAVTSATFGSKTGEAMAVGERTPLGVYSSSSSVRIAVAEALTNIASAPIEKIDKVTLSANWMAAVSEPGQSQALREAVHSVSKFCQDIGVTIPVGKDSLSMKTVWEDKGQQKSVVSPLSMIATAFAPVYDTSRVLTPQLQNTSSRLILIDVGRGLDRMGGSILSQIENSDDSTCPDIDTKDIKELFELVQKLNKEGRVLAYHDRSDGGLFVTLSEMMFASRLGVQIDIDQIGEHDLTALFNEEIGVVLQVAEDQAKDVLATINKKLPGCGYDIGTTTPDQKLSIHRGGALIYQASRSDLEAKWDRTSTEIRKLRENPDTVEQEQNIISNDYDKGLFSDINFEVPEPLPARLKTPKVAILREQGVNGQVEMAAAFTHAGFEAHDVHMTDLISGAKKLDDYSVLAVCGGFSYGDTLGAGAGWAKSILNDPELKSQFKNFFERPDTLTLGVCNGCQMLSHLKSIIPGAEDWPTLKQNISEQFEARVASIKIDESPSVFLKGMAGSSLLVPVAHGEGRMDFASTVNNVVARYVDDSGKPTEAYPYNPNGSVSGVSAVTTKDGRVTIMMPHPERAFLSIQNSYNPYSDVKYSPWFKIFVNSYKWVSGIY